MYLLRHFPHPFFFLGILATRTKSQIASIAIIFEKKYGLSLLEQVVSDMTTLLGKLITGKETGLGKLLTYRILPQDERGLQILFFYFFISAILFIYFHDDDNNIDSNNHEDNCNNDNNHDSNNYNNYGNSYTDNDNNVNLYNYLDAAFLRDSSNGIGLDDENLIEIICTRSNAELQVGNFFLQY